MKTFCFFQVATVDIFAAVFIQMYHMINYQGKNQISQHRAMEAVDYSEPDIQTDPTFGDVLNIVLLISFSAVVIAIQVKILKFLRFMPKLNTIAKTYRKMRTQPLSR